MLIEINSIIGYKGKRYNFYSITARFLQYILTFLSEFNVSLQRE